MSHGDSTILSAWQCGLWCGECSVAAGSGAGGEWGWTPMLCQVVGASAGLHQTELAGKRGGVCTFMLWLCDQSSF